MLLLSAEFSFPSLFCFAAAGLSERAAEAKWSVDFNILRREQRSSVDLEGRDQGLVPCVAIVSLK